jgi:hypothetical protein
LAWAAGPAQLGSWVVGPLSHHYEIQSLFRACKGFLCAYGNTGCLASSDWVSFTFGASNNFKPGHYNHRRAGKQNSGVYLADNAVSFLGYIGWPRILSATVEQNISLMTAMWSNQFLEPSAADPCGSTTRSMSQVGVGSPHGRRH